MPYYDMCPRMAPTHVNHSQLPGVPTMTVSIYLTPKNNWRMERRASWYFRNVLMKSFAVLDGDLAPVCGGCASRTCATTKSETPLSWIPQ